MIGLIEKLTDSRLVKIDPQEENFYDNVLNCKTSDKAINAFIEDIKEAKDKKIQAFYKPIYDPSVDDNNIIIYQEGKKPAIGYSYNWWVNKAKKMPAVEGRKWHIANEYQYYTFLVWLINQLVKSGTSVKESLKMVVLDSTELGNYHDSAKEDEFEPTGSRCVCGVYDLANAYKILSCSNEDGTFYLGAGSYDEDGCDYSLANINLDTDVKGISDCGIGLLVI